MKKKILGFKVIHHPNENKLYRFTHPDYKDWQFIAVKDAFKRPNYTPDTIMAFNVKRGLFANTDLDDDESLRESLDDLRDLIKEYEDNNSSFEVS